MIDINNSGPAFPTSFSKDYPTEIVGGMTLREYAAIKLRVPDSGTDWLDEMIRKSVRDELAARAMQGFAAAENTGWKSMDHIAETAYEWADAMLRAKEAA